MQDSTLHRAFDPGDVVAITALCDQQRSYRWTGTGSSNRRFPQNSSRLRPAATGAEPPEEQPAPAGAGAQGTVAARPVVTMRLAVMTADAARKPTGASPMHCPMTTMPSAARSNSPERDGEHHGRTSSRQGRLRHRRRSRPGPQSRDPAGRRGRGHHRHQPDRRLAHDRRRRPAPDRQWRRIDHLRQLHRGDQGPAVLRAVRSGQARRRRPRQVNGQRACQAQHQGQYRPPACPPPWPRIRTSVRST